MELLERRQHIISGYSVSGTLPAISLGISNACFHVVTLEAARLQTAHIAVIWPANERQLLVRRN
jgi:hypothetical protein